MMYTYKHICNVLSQRYQNVTIQYHSHKRSCVFSMEGYHNSKFLGPYEQLVWT